MELYYLFIDDLTCFIRRKKKLTIDHLSGKYLLDNRIDYIRWYLTELISCEVHPEYLFKKPEMFPVYSLFSTVGQVKKYLFPLLIKFLNEEVEYANSTKFELLSEFR